MLPAILIIRHGDIGILFFPLYNFNQIIFSISNEEAIGIWDEYCLFNINTPFFHPGPRRLGIIHLQCHVVLAVWLTPGPARGREEKPA